MILSFPVKVQYMAAMIIALTYHFYDECIISGSQFQYKISSQKINTKNKYKECEYISILLMQHIYFFILTT